PQDARSDGARVGIEPAGVRPVRQADLLAEVLGSRRIERLDGEAEDQPGEATVEQPERLRGAFGDLAHQLLVAGGVLRRWHPPVSVRGSVHRRRVVVRGGACSHQASQRSATTRYYTGGGDLAWSGDETG